jgi:ATP-dependent DNA helicase PIF1
VAKDSGNPNYVNKLDDVCPVPGKLLLKEGAQVMLVKNMNLSLVNGSLGIITGFCPETSSPIVKFDNGLIAQMEPVEFNHEVNHKVVATRLQVGVIFNVSNVAC